MDCSTHPQTQSAETWWERKTHQPGGGDAARLRPRLTSPPLGADAPYFPGSATEKRSEARG